MNKPSLEQMSDDLRDIAADLVLAKERYDSSILVDCCIRLRRISHEVTRCAEELGLETDERIIEAARHER
jgi:hypothetical protein